MAFEGRDTGNDVSRGYELPGHDEISLATRVYEAVSIVTAVVLLAAHAVRIASAPFARVVAAGRGGRRGRLRRLRLGPGSLGGRHLGAGERCP